MKSLDYITARKLVAGNTGSVRYLNDEIIEKERSDQNLDLWLKKITPLYPTNPTDPVIKETTNYVDYIHQFITRKSDERLPPFSGAMFPVQIFPLAMREKVEALGFEPYLQFVKEALQKGRKRFHIIAAGKTNIELAKSCAERISKNFRL
jgi:hypothetical protein